MSDTTEVELTLYAASMVEYNITLTPHQNNFNICNKIKILQVHKILPILFLSVLLQKHVWKFRSMLVAKSDEKYLIKRWFLLPFAGFNVS